MVAQLVENLHVTLKFLGPVAVERLAEIGAVLADSLAQVSAFEVGVRGFGAFPSERRAKILFAGVGDAGDGAGGLGKIAGVVDDVAARFGFPREDRPFTGHVTIGRSKGGVDARRALAPFAGRVFGTARIDEVHVYESQLARRGDAGSTYVLRSRAGLAARAAN